MEQDSTEGHGSCPVQDAIQVMSQMALPLFASTLRLCFHWLHDRSVLE